MLVVLAIRQRDTVRRRMVWGSAAQLGHLSIPVGTVLGGDTALEHTVCLAKQDKAAEAFHWDRYQAALLAHSLSPTKSVAHEVV